MNPQIDLSNEAASSWGEWGIVIAVVVIAGVYLWRKFFIKKGCGCSGCSQSKSCASATLKKPDIEIKPETESPKG